MLRIEERCSLFLSSLLNIFLWEDGFSALQKETKVKNLMNPCSSSPCFPNATCLNGFTDKRYIFLCQVGFKGKQCGKKVTRS